MLALSFVTVHVAAFGDTTNLHIVDLDIPVFPFVLFWGEGRTVAGTGRSDWTDGGRGGRHRESTAVIGCFGWKGVAKE